MKDRKKIVDFTLDELKELGKVIRKLRIERGLRQRDLAEAIGMSVATVSLIEAGKHQLTYKQLVAIGEELKTNHLSLIWQAQRTKLSKKDGMQGLIAVFDTLLTTIDKQATEETRTTPTSEIGRLELNGQVN